MTPDALDRILGPAGVVVVLLYIAWILWRDHLRSDEEDRKQRDRALALTEALIPAVDRLTSAVLADIEDRAKRRRESDP